MRIILILLFYSCIISSCLDKQKTDCESVAPAPVTDVTGPSTTTLAQPVSFRINYAISNGCGNFDQIETLTDGDTTEVVVKAKYIGCVCTQQIINAQTDYLYTPTTNGTHYFKFFIGGQQFLTKTLQVL